MLLQQRLEMIISELDGTYEDVVQFFRRGNHCGTEADTESCVIANYIRGRFSMALGVRSIDRLYITVTDETIKIALKGKVSIVVPNEVLKRFITDFDNGDYSDLVGKSRYRRIAPPRQSRREYPEYEEYSAV